MEADSTTTTTWSFLLLPSLLASSLLFFLLHRSHGARSSSNKARRLPPGPPMLLFLAKFLALRRSIFDLGPLLRDLHARHGPIISLRLFATTLVFVSDRRLAHRALVQGGAAFADRPPLAEPDSLFSAGGRDINSSPYGPYWRLVRRNLAAEALHRSRVALFAPARARACDALVADLLFLRAGDAAGVVELRPSLRRAVLGLMVYMCFGAWIGEEALGEVEQLQRGVLMPYTSFPVFAFFPAVTKRLFRRRWAAYVALARRQDEVFVPLIHATRGDDEPPCYAESLLALRVPDDGGEDDRPLTDAEMSSLCSEFLTPGRTRR
ncbi:hypothetical protein HU200_046800 [Digitaria exilis]|uniref:Cytochrome P450 n=1 Tax=Digitaria exilis TaxID=1010633 RepID=A0A835AW22_9POAL|nr:hypothetical protein HU200_046800 [Digitaria exilis]CAB3445261.1 unnamed protein product [Digitaria exilis]